MVIDVFCEDIDFPNGSTIFTTTANGVFRAGFARCAIGPSPSGFMISKSFPAGGVTSAWYAFYGIHARQVTNNIMLAGFGKVGTQIGIGVIVDNNGKIALGSYVNGTVTSLVSSTIPQNISLNRYDLQLISLGAATTINLYYNGTFLASYSGDLTSLGIPNIDCIVSGNQTSGSGFGAGNYIAISECIVADESTLGYQGVDLREITANGTTQQWNNPDISNFDSITINDANSSYSNTAGQDEQAVLGNSVAGNFAIKAIKIVARANAPAGSAITNLKLGLANGSGTIGVGASHTLGTAFAPVADLLTVDPTTGQPFTSIDGYQLDLRSA